VGKGSEGRIVPLCRSEEGRRGSFVLFLRKREGEKKRERPNLGGRVHKKGEETRSFTLTPTPPEKGEGESLIFTPGVAGKRGKENGDRVEVLPLPIYPG